MGDSMTFEDGRTTHQYPAQPGMSLHDWFMGQALQGLLEPDDVHYTDGNRNRLKAIVSVARQIADAMMEAREASNDKQ